MTDLTLATRRVRALLIPLLLAACAGKEGLLTEHGSSSDSSSEAATDSATSTSDGSTSDGSSTGEATTGPVNTATGTSTTAGTTSVGTTTTGETTTVGTTTTGDTTTGGQFSGDAALYQDCAPTDGPAFRIEVGVTSATCDAPWPTPDMLRIVVYVAAPAAPGDYPLGFPDGGQAFLDNGDGNPEFALDGTVTIDSWQADQVSGSYDVTFEGGTHLTGEFAGPYCGGPALCG
jgi:hypothetical protein